jgi:hypothetical protein
MNKKLVALMILVVVGLAFAVGYLLPREPVTIPYPVYSTNEIVRVEYAPPITITNTTNNTIERIVTNNATEYVDRIINGQLREFTSVGKLTDWVNEHQLQISGDVDCDDYAMRLQQQAYEDGYMVSVQLIFNGYLDDVRVSDVMGAHMGNLVIIGNNIYWIEPQQAHVKIVFITYLD